MSERPRGPWDFDEPPPSPARRGGRARPLLWAVFLAALGGLLFALFQLFPDAVKTKDDWADVGWAVGFLLLLATGLLRGGRVIVRQHLAHAALWAAIVAALALGFAYREDLARVPQRLLLAFGTGYPIATAEHEVVVPQDAQGAFVLNARVNGQPVRFIVDTGATDTVLAPDTARRLGVDVDKLEFVQSAEPAKGMGYGAAFTAQRLEVGPIAFADFPMIINRASMTSSLLGLSFLNRLEDFEIRDRKLILKWREPAPAAGKPLSPATTPAKPAPAKK